MGQGGVGCADSACLGGPARAAGEQAPARRRPTLWPARRRRPPAPPPQKRPELVALAELVNHYLAKVPLLEWFVRVSMEGAAAPLCLQLRAPAGVEAAAVGGEGVAGAAAEAHSEWCPG